MPLPPSKYDFVVRQGLIVLGNQAVTSSTGNTNAFEVDGGAAIGKNLIVGSTATIWGDTSLLSTLQVLSTATFNNNIVINLNENATNSQTGALRVVGGVGIQGDLYARNIYTNGRLLTDFSGTATNLAGGSPGNIPYQIATSSTGFITNGNPGDVLIFNGLIPVWQAASSVASSTATNLSFGLEGEIPFQIASGQTRFSSNFTWTSSTNLLSVSNVRITSNVNSTDTNSGALIVQGGAGISDNLYVGNNLTVNGIINGIITTATSILGGYVANILAGTDTVITNSLNTLTISNNSTLQSVTARGATSNQNLLLSSLTESTSTTSGALVVQGGVGIAKNLTVGGLASLANLTVTSSTVFSIVSATNITVSGKINILDGTDALADNVGSLVTEGGIAAAQSIFIGGTITTGDTLAQIPGSVVPALYSNNLLLSTFTSPTITSSGIVYLDTFSTSTYRTAKYTTQIVDGSTIRISELLVSHDNVNAYIHEYGIIANNGLLGAFDATLISGQIILTFNVTTSPSAMNIKIVRIGISL